jgi:amino acid transporter
MNPKRVFVREATGLVRSWSAWDLLIYNILASPAIFTGVAYSLFGETLGTFPGANPYLGIVLAAVGALPVMAMYAILSSAMPRSGGDYVWVSRILHPSLAFAYSTVFVTTSVTLYMAWNGWILAYLGFSSAFGILGSVTGSASYLGLSSFFLGNPVVLLISFIGIAGAAVITARGMKTIAAAQKTWLALTTGVFIFFVLVLASTSQSVFIERFNSFFSSLGPNTYQQVIQTANLSSTWPSTFSLRDTVVWASYTEGLFLAAWWGVPMIGEIKGTGNVRNLTIAMCFPLILYLVEYLVLIALFERTIGWPFLASLGYLMSTGNPLVANMPFKPYFVNFPSIIVAGNVTYLYAVVGLVLVLTLLSTWTFNILNILNPSRYLFAQAFDRVLPSRLASINDRTHSPLVAIAVCVIGGVLWTIWTIFQPSVWAFTGAAAVTTTCLPIFPSLAALFFPRRLRNTFEGSTAAKYRSTLPLLAIYSLVWTVAMVVAFWPIAAVGLFPASYYLFAGLFVVCIAYYFVRSWYLKRQGLDLRIAFNQLPPE